MYVFWCVWLLTLDNLRTLLDVECIVCRFGGRLCTFPLLFFPSGISNSLHQWTQLWFWIWLIHEISIEVAKKLTWTTFSNGYLGSRNDEERSEMRYVVRIAKLSESSKFWTQIALLGIPWSMLLWESILYQLEHVKALFIWSSSQQSVTLLTYNWLLCLDNGFHLLVLCYLRLVLFALCLLIDLLVALQTRNTGGSLDCQSFFVVRLRILSRLVV